MSCIVIVSGPNEGMLFNIDIDEVVIGRGDDCQLQLVDEKASRNHCRIQKQHGATLGGTGIPTTQFGLMDLGSSNGTTLDGHAMSEEAILVDGSTIGIGTTRLVFLKDTFDTSEEAMEYCSNIGKDNATKSDDSWPLDPPWKTQTLSEIDPRGQG